jgi:hypothetical protein
MLPEKVVVVRGRPKGVCKTPHASPRQEVARGVCQSCLNIGYAKIRKKECTDDEDLVDRGFWLPKGYTISDYIDDVLKHA